MFVPRKDALPGARHPVEPTSANPAPLPTFRRAPWAASIRARMNILGLSLRNAAPKIGVSVATLNRISREDGVAEPGMTTYLRVNRWLADTYGTVMQAGCDANPTVCHAGRDAETPDDLIGWLRLAAGRDYNVSGYNEDNRCLEDITPLLWKAARMIDRLNTHPHQSTGAKPGRQSSVGEPQPKDTK